MRSHAIVDALALAVLLVGVGCQRPEPPPLVVLVGLDGASLDFVDELRAQGRLPALDRLIREGAAGPLQSWASRRLFSENRRSDFWSPIVWTSIATGKVPEKHGVRDFVLPAPGSSSVWITGDDGRASVRLPELPADAALRLVMRLRSHPGVGEQEVAIALNGEPLGAARARTEWSELAVVAPPGAAAPMENALELVFSRPRRGRIAELASLRIEDRDRRTIYELDPAFEPGRLTAGFATPTSRLVETQSVHWRAKPVWSLLSERDVPVGVLGYWGTWPAYPVNGFLVSPRIREHDAGTERLSWPLELAAELAPLAPTVDDLAGLFAELHVSECEPPLIDEQSVLKKILLRDAHTSRMTRELLPRLGETGLLAVYFRAIDVAAHPTLHWRYGADIPDSCPETVREIVDEVYVQIDRWLAEIVEALPSDATLIIASDHGMRPIDGGGHHSAMGLVIGHGTGIRTGVTFHGSTVLDIAPTLLHLADVPIPLDMDGKTIAPMFEAEWLSSHPARYADVDTSLEQGDISGSDEASEEALEELRSLGYIR